MIYLDSRSNKKAAPNENYSRELMELFSLGIGHFTEKDVRESARAFTGWQLKAKTEFIFNRGQHDYGIKTFLGRTGRFDGDDIVDIIMAQPVAAEYVCTQAVELFRLPGPGTGCRLPPRRHFQREQHRDTPRGAGNFPGRRVLLGPRGGRAGEGPGGAGCPELCEPSA